MALGLRTFSRFSWFYHGSLPLLPTISPNQEVLNSLSQLICAVLQPHILYGCPFYFGVSLKISASCKQSMDGSLASQFPCGSLQGPFFYWSSTAKMTVTTLRNTPFPIALLFLQIKKIEAACSAWRGSQGYAACGKHLEREQAAAAAAPTNRLTSAVK